MADHETPPIATDAPPDGATRLLILTGGPIAALPLVAITSVLPQIGQALAHGPGDALLVKQLVGGVGLAMMIGAALAGLLIERIGLRRVLIGSALIYTVAGTAGLWLSDLIGLLASRLLLGIAAATVQVACILVVNTRLAGTARARWMGLHISSAMAVTILIHPIAGALGTLGWRWPFILYAAGLILIPAARAQPAFVRRPRPAAAADGPRGWFPFRFILLAFAVGSIVYMPSIQIPFLLRERGLTSPASIALVLTADALAGVIVASGFGAARQRLSSGTAFMISFAAAAIGLTIAATAPALPLLVMGLMIYGGGVGWFTPNLMTALAAAVPVERQGRATGIVKAAHYVSAPIAVALIEPVARTYGPAATLAAAALLAGVILLVFTTAGGMTRYRRNR